MFAMMGYFVKLLAEEMSSLEIVFFRNIFGVVLIAATFYHLPAKSPGGKPWLLFFRGFVGFMALLLFFYNITVMSLADAMTYSKTSPIFTAIFAFVFLKEELHKRAWGAVFLGFLGMILVVNPGGLALDKYALTGLLSGIGAALAYTSIRELKHYYEPRMIVMSFVLTGTIGPVVLMAVGEVYRPEALDFMLAEFVMPSGMSWVYLGTMGVLATLSQLFMTKSYATIEAGVAGAVSYTNILFAILIGLFIGEGLPDGVTTAGIVLIVATGVLVGRKKTI
jgi:drug/metabolite transporter (DMT)-like permease